MSELLPLLRQRFFDDNGLPLAGGKLFSYLAGTTTPVATYVDQSALTPNTNPIILDANGECEVWIVDGSYKFVLEDLNDVEQWSVDNVNSGTTEAQSVWATHSVSDGQVATDLIGETMDLSVNSSAFYDFEIIRGTTVLSNGQLAIQGINSVARVVTGIAMAQEPHGVSFSVSQAGLVAQLRAALSSGLGNGTIKLSKRLVPV